MVVAVGLSLVGVHMQEGTRQAGRQIGRYVDTED